MPETRRKTEGRTGRDAGRKAGRKTGRRADEPAPGATGVEKYPNLFREGRFGPLTLRNRIVMAPMGTSYGTPDGRVTERHLHYYAERARGGAAMIITEVVGVEDAIDPTPAGNLLRLDSETQISGFHDLVEVIHDHGTAACIQLTPGFGRQGVPPTPGRPPVSSSDIPAFSPPGVVCHGLSREEIGRLVQAFGDAAGRAATSGFDAIEIHGHTGYLVDQFLSPLWNKRTDEYGGSLENRARFAIELIGAVRDRLGPEFPLSFRFSADLKIPGGRTIEEARETARWLAWAGASVLHVDAGSYDAMPWIFPPMYYGMGPLADLAGVVKDAVDIPVIAVGNILDPALAEEVIATGKADFVASGRGLLADPEWPRKTLEGREGEIRRCIMCNDFCVGNILEGKPVGCVVNPRAGREFYYGPEPSERPPARESRKVVVVGGGPAGMQAAVTAAERGHKVVLFERQEELGGQLLLASAPEFKRSLGFPVGYLTGRLEKLGVEVKLGTEATSDLVAAEKPDSVVVATGARPLVPSIPGVNRGNVLTAWDLHRRGARRRTGEARGGEIEAAALGAAGDVGVEPVRAAGTHNADAAVAPNAAGDDGLYDDLGRTVIVAGGGLVGCETALDLARHGKDVIVVEMLPEVATDLNLANRIALLGLLSEAGVRLLTSHKITAIGESGVDVVGPGGEGTTIPGETVVLAFGAEPERELARSLKQRHGRVLVVGDSAKPRKIGAAIHEGFAAGLET